MAADKTTFETIKPSRFITLTFPKSSNSTTLLRVAVFDSPFQFTNPPRVATILVPKYRESDWIFSTESGHLQLLLSSPEISRLILIGNQPSDVHHSPEIYHRPSKIDASSDDELGDHQRQRDWEVWSRFLFLPSSEPQLSWKGDPPAAIGCTTALQLQVSLKFFHLHTQYQFDSRSGNLAEPNQEKRA